MKRAMTKVLAAMFVTALFAAPAAYADHDHGRGNGRGHDKHEWKERKHAEKRWERERWERERWAARHRGYYYQQPPVAQYYQPAPAVVYQPQPVYRPYYAQPSELNFNFRVPLN